MLWVLHADLDGIARGTREPIPSAREATSEARATCIRLGVAVQRTRHFAPVINANNIMTGDHLAQTAVHGIAHLDEVVIEEN